jgi:hypothetical protein
MWNTALPGCVAGHMSYTELHLAQLERRVLAGERCVSRQREILKHHIDAELPTDAALKRLAECEATLLNLRRCHNRIRDEIAAANTRGLLDLFWKLPARESASASRELS